VKQISQSELVIMNVLWVRAPQNKHGMGANEVAENVTSESWNIKTVKTLLYDIQALLEALKTAEGEGS